MSFEIKPATRVGIVPWIDLYSESGCGKTMSSLLLARGLAGPSGKIVLCDSEERRGSLYADVIPGGYDVLDFGPPFSPARYLEVLEVAFNAGAAVVVVDSMSHEWGAEGGVLDMATQNEEKSGKSGLHNWRIPKIEHQRLVNRLLRSPVPLICCIRAKFKTRQVKENGKTLIVTDDATSPIQSEEFIFEATAHMEVLQDHSIRLTKCSHPSLRDCFPDKGPITVEHGAAVARWCAAGGQAPAKTIRAVHSFKKLTWDLLAKVHGGDPEKAKEWLWKNNLLSDAEAEAGLKALTEARWQDIHGEAVKLLNQKP